MNIKLYKKQYEFECICGHVWIDDTNNGCPMCGEKIQIITESYDSLPPEGFSKHQKKK